MLTVRIVDLPAGDAHGELALRGWPAIQAWPHDTALRQELSVCNIVACRVSSGRARPSATASGWARACGQAQARARNAGAFVVGPHATRALRARSAWRGGRIRSTKEYQRARRHIAPGKERIANKPKALAFGLGSVQSPHRTLCLHIVCVCMPEFSHGGEKLHVPRGARLRCTRAPFVVRCPACTATRTACAGGIVQARRTRELCLLQVPEVSHADCAMNGTEAVETSKP